jgi:hypothetical protein
VFLIMQHFFNTNAYSCNGDVLTNLNVLNAWHNGIDNTIYVASRANICWALRKAFPIFWMQVCASILFSLQLIIIFSILLSLFYLFLLDKMYNISIKYELNIYVCLPKISNMNTKGIFLPLHNLCKIIVNFIFILLIMHWCMCLYL